MHKVTITNNNANQRLDKFLKKYLNAAPKGFLYKMLRKKNITCNNNKAHGHEILREGDSIVFFLSEETLKKFMAEKETPIQAGPLDIVFEDANILICNKPTGLLSQRSVAAPQDTLMDRILFYLQKKGEYSTSIDATFTPGICNRLDRNTSGIVVCGKNLPALQWLNRQRQLEKFYLAIVKGHIGQPGVLHGFHQKTAGNISVLQPAEADGTKQAITEYIPIKSQRDVSLVEVKLVTGKSHQIRAHFSHMAHPICGDPKYGDAAYNRILAKRFGVRSQLLHAHKLVFCGEEGPLAYLSGLKVASKPPPQFRDTMVELGLN